MKTITRFFSRPAVSDMHLACGLVFAAFLALGTLPKAEAREITAEEAAKAVERWSGGNGIPFGARGIGGIKVSHVSTARDGNGTPLYHAVHLESGTFVVTAAESALEPVIAFSDSEEAIAEGENPLWDILENDMGKRMERLSRIRANTRAVSKGGASGTDAEIARNEENWSKLLADSRPKAGRVSSPGDVRVSPLVKTSWDQGKANGKHVYNYSTPNHYPCGCVATALAQLMRHHKHPTAAIPRFSRMCTVDGVTVEKWTEGGKFDWSLMPESPARTSLTEAQCKAIGKLCYEVGVSINTDWNAGQSASTTQRTALALRNVWKYASAVAHDTRQMFYPSPAEIQNAMFANFDAGYPVILGISEHTVVGDGYGFSGTTAYTHLNLGWGGAGNGYWYNLPTVNVPEIGGYSSSILEDIIYNVFPDKTGVLITGRVLDEAGKPVAGATVTGRKGTVQASDTTDAKGIYSLLVPVAGNYVVSAVSGSRTSPETTVGVVACVTTPCVLDESGLLTVTPFVSVVGNSWGNNLVVAAAPPQTVEFKANGGTCGTVSKKYVTGKAYGELPAASRNGHAFLGWFTQEAGGTRVTAQSIVPATKTRTLYAQWEEAAEPLKVWRFYSEKNKGHFFTIGEAEKTQLLTTSLTWTFQGGAYRAYKTKASGTVPLYRFYSEKYKGHFFTRSDAEKNSLVSTSKTWKYQGIAFYVYPKAASGRIPVYRFWSDSYGHHFYTASEAEKNNLVATSKTWKYQGIAFWAEPLDMARATVKFNANGGSCGTASKTYTSGKAFGELPTATRNGHAFLGWFTAASGGTRVTAQTPVTGTATRTLYARWEAAAEPLKVWRFYSEKNKGHFFTISEAEKTQLLTTSPTWSFQGGAYRAYKTKVSGTVPLYRFYSESYKGHFFTRSESEKNSLRSTSKTWKYEGIAYYVYPSAASGRIPVYRFWSDSYRHHFYTANEAEKNGLRSTSKTWTYQGIAFWALPTESDKHGTLTVHDGNSTDSYVPVHGFYSDAYLKCEMVYPAGELAPMKGCTISKMTFYATQSSIDWGTRFRVFVKEVNGKTISAFSGPGKVVYEGRLSISGNRMVVPFSTTYTYNGGNLLVGIYQTDRGEYTISTWKGESVSGASIQGYSYSSLGSVSPTQRNFLPKTTFEYASGTAKSAAAGSGGGLLRKAAAESLADGNGTDVARLRGEKRAGNALSVTEGKMRLVAAGAEVTTSNRTDGSAVADGDEGTAWEPEHPEGGSWLVLTFAEPLDVAEVRVAGENLPEDTRVLLSEDAETWFEGEGGTAQYVWVVFPPVGKGLQVNEVWVTEGCLTEE